MWFCGSGGMLHLESPGAASVLDLRQAHDRVWNGEEIHTGVPMLGQLAPEPAPLSKMNFTIMSDKENRRRSYRLSTLQGTARTRNLRWPESGRRHDVPGNSMHQLWIYRGPRGSCESPPSSCGKTSSALRDGRDGKSCVYEDRKDRSSGGWQASLHQRFLS